MLKSSLLCLISCLMVTKAFVPLEKCIEDLGCFKNLGDFYHVLYRPIAILPNGREAIGTKFRLYTNANPLLEQELDNLDNETDFSGTLFNVSRETKVIIHGFREEQAEWMIELKDAFLSEALMNVITVDWGQGAGIPYTQAATNTRVVGAELALLLSRLQDQLSLDLNLVHLIGFSLGAHVAGYAGERLHTVRRITGLDPAGPLFEDLPPVVRLDPSDALFVDAIHTDGRSILKLSFGSFSPMGQLDFYPNDGHKQPGCPENPVDTLSYATLGALLKGLDQAGLEIGCRHSRARDLFLDSLRNKECRPVGFPCQDWKTFEEGQCYTCGDDGKSCGVLGIDSEKNKPSNIQNQGVKLYLKTRDSKPFCLFHYNLQLRVPSNSAGKWTGKLRDSASYGTISVSLTGSNKNTVHAQLTESDQVFEFGNDYHFLLTSETDLGNIESLLLKWTDASAVDRFFRIRWKLNDGLPVESINVTSMSDEGQETWLFCAQEQIVSFEQPILLLAVKNC